MTLILGGNGQQETVYQWYSRSQTGSRPKDCQAEWTRSGRLAVSKFQASTKREAQRSTGAHLILSSQQSVTSVLPSLSELPPKGLPLSEEIPPSIRTATGNFNRNHLTCDYSSTTVNAIVAPDVHESSGGQNHAIYPCTSFRLAEESWEVRELREGL